MDNALPQPGDVIEVTTERLAYGGDAIARYRGLVVFIPFGAANERLRVRLIDRKKSYARGSIEAVLEPSESRRKPPCRYFGICGGCQLQHLDYQSQLNAKVGFVRDALERIGKLNWPHAIEIKHASEFGYRGRAQLKVDRRTRSVGFNRAASNDLCDVSSCPILLPVLDDSIKTIRSALATEWTQNDSLPDRFQIEIAAGDSQVSCKPALEGLNNIPLECAVNGLKYRYGPSTFFQANPALLHTLIDEAVGRESGDVAVELYAGVGFFSLPLAQRFNHVIGVESDRISVDFARQNIVTNGFKNIDLHCSSVESWLKAFRGMAPSPDLLLLDPPRGGASESIKEIIALQPGRISYVSCDPTTLARDLRSLVGSGYQLSCITAIDLFPQTYHIETIALLERSE